MFMSVTAQSRWIFTAALISLFSGTAYAGGFAAIAYDKTTGKWGRYQGADYQSDAQNGAIQECANAGGVNCESVGWAYDGYVALAVGDGGHFGTGNVHDSQGDAENASLAVCQNVTTNCFIAADASAFE